MKKNYRNALITLLAGGVVSLILMGKKDGIISPENTIPRNEYGEGSLSVSLLAKGDGHTMKIPYEVAEREYTEEEVQRLAEEAFLALEEVLPGGNESLDEVSKNLYFPESLEEFPFAFEYDVEIGSGISRYGEVEGITEEKVVCVGVSARYETYEFLYTIPLRLVPMPQSEAKIWEEKVLSALEDAQRISKTKESFPLPGQVDGAGILWEEDKKSKGKPVLLLTFLLCGVFLFSDKIAEKEAAKKRKKQLEEEYPAFALKYSMLVSAGLTLRQALVKIAKGNSPLDSALYPELKRGLAELENGVSEGTVYENIGFRCNTPKMRKFGTLLASNLKKGSGGLSALLREEAMQALAEKRELIRTKGETAGTKLLFPMLLLLLIVFVMIMVPAFSSFTL